MSLFTLSHTVADELRALAKKAPAGGLFHDVKLSPVEGVGLLFGPNHFFIEVKGRTLMVSVQDVSPGREGGA